MLRLRDVEQKTGIKHTLIYSLMKQGRFPKRLRIGRRTVAWHSLEIDRWMDARIAERDAHDDAVTSVSW